MKETKFNVLCSRFKVEIKLTAQIDISAHVTEDIKKILDTGFRRHDIHLAQGMRPASPGFRLARL